MERLSQEQVLKTIYEKADGYNFSCHFNPLGQITFVDTKNEIYHQYFHDCNFEEWLESNLRYTFSITKIMKVVKTKYGTLIIHFRGENL